MEKRTGTKEWSDHSANAMIGCSNDCLYCYGRTNTLRFNQLKGRLWGEEEAKPGIVDKEWPHHHGVVMYPTAHDLTPDNLYITLPVLRNLLRKGNKVLVVSKPHPAVIKEICEDYVVSNNKEQVTFRFTIGGHQPQLGFWEPNAPPFADRLLALSIACNHEYKTSVSMEPLLQYYISEVLDLIHLVDPNVTGEIWIGKLNKLKERLNWMRGTASHELALMRGQDLLEHQNKAWWQCLYDDLRFNPKIRWKDSVRELLGLDKKEGQPQG